MKLRIKRERKIPDITTAPTRPIMNTPSGNICTRKGMKSAEGTKSLRSPSHQELTYREDGAFIRVCSKWNEPAILVPVTDHKDAYRKSLAIYDCQKAGTDAESCALQYGGDRNVLGGARRPRRRRRARR